MAWLAIIAVRLLHKDEFTLEGILSYTPRQPVLAAVMLWALFAVKSLSIFLYSGLLYAASGILFPLPVAIAVNIAGTAVMVSIPYWLGKKLGSQAVQYILSADVVSGYMGAVGVRYKEYLPACLLGLLSACTLFPIMGMSLSDIRSPQFLMAASIQLAEMLISCVTFHFYRRKHAAHWKPQAEKLWAEDHS